MEKPRGTKVSEFHIVMKLINQIFRINRGCEPTMGEEFPLLLSEENADNMRIIEVDSKPVSCVNFVKRNMVIQGAEIKIASIGAVCTDREYRGRGYASLILEDVENKMFQDGVDIALVSGTRALYQRRGYTLTKNFIKYVVYPKEDTRENFHEGFRSEEFGGSPISFEGGELEVISNEKISFENFSLEEFKEEELQQVMKVYNAYSTRFIRPVEDFKKLVRSALFPWGRISYKAYVIKENNLISGYIFLRIINKEEPIGEVVEAIGRPDYLEKALKELAIKNKLESIEYRVNINDRNNFLNYCGNGTLDYQEGSVKVINFEKFMESLRPYFAQYVEREILNKICFKAVENGEKTENKDRDYLPEWKAQEKGKDDNEGDGFKLNVSEDILNHIEVMKSQQIYYFIYDNEILEVTDIRTLNKLVFEDNYSLNIDFNDKKHLKEFIENVFPIPFVYTGNLNYQ